jgi:hypothetical protein
MMAIVTRAAARLERRRYTGEEMLLLISPSHITDVATAGSCTRVEISLLFQRNMLRILSHPLVAANNGILPYRILRLDAGGYDG